MSGPLAVLVNSSSATHTRPGEDQPHKIHGINRNHSDLIKFAPGDLDYSIVLGFLQEFATCATEVIQARFQETRDTLAKGQSEIL